MKWVPSAAAAQRSWPAASSLCVLFCGACLCRENALGALPQWGSRHRRSGFQSRPHLRV